MAAFVIVDGFDGFEIDGPQSSGFHSVAIFKKRIGKWKSKRKYGTYKSLKYKRLYGYSVLVKVAVSQVKN